MSLKKISLCDLDHTRTGDLSDTGPPSAFPEGSIRMKGNHNSLATPQRLLRTHPLPTLYGSTESPDGDKPFELVAIYLWSVVGVALATLLIWLALGGHV